MSARATVLAFLFVADVFLLVAGYSGGDERFFR
jgi:hypothetical protein